ncbi:MAG: polyhydroxyalkanoate depolymerase [Pseudomonadota bacterium]
MTKTRPKVRMYYFFYEWNHAFLSPMRAMNDAVRLYYKNPLNPLAHTEVGKQISAAGDLFERMTRRYGKPEFGLDTTTVNGHVVPVRERIVWERPFCRLVHFARQMPADMPRQSRVVIVAPMSGHYATLLRGTVAALLPHHDVYITDWVDARMVPLGMGRFDLDDYIDYVTDWVNFFEGDLHMVAVCQPAVPVFGATALLEQRKAGHLPRSITLMGGPIDTRESPTEVNTFAAGKDLDWFRRNVIMTVPFPHPGVMRRVYPGFLQLTGFMTMNLNRHVTAHYDYFDHLVRGDGDSADKHREFYDEYLSVMDLTEEFYMQTVDTVFLRHALPAGTMRHRGVVVNPSAIERTPIFTIEGEMDDISGLGQTEAAHALTPHLPAEKHRHYMQPEVGHYGVFNGSRFRKEIAPRITEFIQTWDAADAAAVPAPQPHQPPANDTAPVAQILEPEIKAAPEPDEEAPVIASGDPAVTPAMDTAKAAAEPLVAVEDQPLAGDTESVEAAPPAEEAAQEGADAPDTEQGVGNTGSVAQAEEAAGTEPVAAPARAKPKRAKSQAANGSVPAVKGAAGPRKSAPKRGTRRRSGKSAESSPPA